MDSDDPFSGYICNKQTNKQKTFKCCKYIPNRIKTSAVISPSLCLTHTSDSVRSNGTRQKGKLTFHKLSSGDSGLA